MRKIMEIRGGNQPIGAALASDLHRRLNVLEERQFQIREAMEQMMALHNSLAGAMNSFMEAVLTNGGVATAVEAWKAKKRAEVVEFEGKGEDK